MTHYEDLLCSCGDDRDKSIHHRSDGPCYVIEQPLHFVQHFLNSGDYVQTVFTCTASEGANCRMVCQTCSDECREACECGSFNEDGDERTPEMVDYGQCLYIVWLNEDAPEECFNGDEQPVRGPEPQAITLEWNGDNYDWDYE